MESLASRANHPVLLGFFLFCAAASLSCALPRPGLAQATPTQPSTAAVAAHFPIVSDARLAGDSRQTRFIMDLDKPVQFRAFALADPYRVVVDLPQLNFQLPAGVGGA